MEVGLLPVAVLIAPPRGALGETAPGLEVFLLVATEAGLPMLLQQAAKRLGKLANGVKMGLEAPI